MEEVMIRGVRFKRTEQNTVLARWYDGFKDFDFVSGSWLINAVQETWGNNWVAGPEKHAGNGHYSVELTLTSSI